MLRCNKPEEFMILYTIVYYIFFNLFRHISTFEFVIIAVSYHRRTVKKGIVKKRKYFPF